MIYTKIVSSSKYKFVVFLYSIQSIFPEDGTSAPKHVVNLTVVMNCILLSAFVGGCVDCKATQVIKNNSIKFAEIYVALADGVFFLSHNVLSFTSLTLS